MPKTPTHCQNPRCGKQLTPVQRNRGNHFCSHRCSIHDKRHHRWNTSPIGVETTRRGSEEW